MSTATLNTAVPNNALTQFVSFYQGLPHIMKVVVWSIALMTLLLLADSVQAITASSTFGPLAPAVTFLQDLGPGIKAIAILIGFIVALISLSFLKDFSKVVFFGGIAIFASVGLTVALAMAGFAI